MSFIGVCAAYYCFLHLAAGAFVETPVSQEVSIGAEAVFRCRYETADIIRWRVNGSLVKRTLSRDITPGTTRDGNGSLVDTLTITGQPEYNGTVVICVARFYNGTPEEQTEPALLLVLVNSSTIERGTFLLSPVSLNLTLDSEAVFQCQHSNAAAINWKINGSILMDPPKGVNSYLSNAGVSILTIIACPEYNQTVIKCVAFFADSPSEESYQTVLMIQGRLSSVIEFHKSFFTLIWIPPPSLDLTNVDPDIVYCVDVYNITCGRRDLIISDCNVTEPSYASDDIAPRGYIYEYIVTPRSNVPGARNGTQSALLKDHYPNFALLSSSLTIKNEHARTYQIIVSLKETGLPLPSAYSILLFSLDDLEDMNFVETNTTVVGELVVLDVIPGLPPKRLWNYTILAYGCRVHPALSAIELSTHDIQNVSVSSPLPGQVRVTGDFIQGSTATGVLAIVYSQSDVHYNYSNQHKGQSVEIDVGGLTVNEYNVSVFVLEGGLPYSGVATSPRPAQVIQQGNLEQGAIIEYEIHSISSGVCITCTFLDSSTTYCLVVIHRRISQLSCSGLMNIESSYKFNRSGDTAYGCIDRVNLTHHQIGVIRGSLTFIMTSPKTSLCSLWCITVIVLGTVIGMSLILTIILLSGCFCLTNRKESHTSSTPEVPVDMKRCAAYEVTTLAKQKVKLESNPAYEQVRVLH